MVLLVLLVLMVLHLCILSYPIFGIDVSNKVVAAPLLINLGNFKIVFIIMVFVYQWLKNLCSISMT